MGHIIKSVTDVTGGWIYPSLPYAVRHVGGQDKTYFGWVDNTGKVYVASYDHQNHVYVENMVHDWNHPSDHANPSLLIRSSDNRVMVFLGGHNQANIYYLISTNPEDVSSFGATKTVAMLYEEPVYYYTQPVELTAEGRMYLFFRRTPRGDEVGYTVHSIAISDDDGETFAEDASMFLRADAWPYTICCNNGVDTVWFARSDNINGYWNRQNIMSCYYKVTSDGLGGFNREFFRLNGTKICDYSELPLTDHTLLDLVYNSEAEGNKSAYILDIGLDENEYPVILFSNLADDAADLNFDGTSSYVDVGTLGSFGGDLGSGKASFWINTTSEEWGSFFGNREGPEIFFNAHIGHTGGVSLGRMYLSITDDNAANLAGATTDDVGFYDGKWHFIEVEWNCATNEIIIKVDGDSKNITYRFQETPNTFSNFTAPFYVGARNSTGAERFFQCVLNRFEIDGFGEWPMFEGMGTTIEDVSVNNNHGTAYNTVWSATADLTRGKNWHMYAWWDGSAWDYSTIIEAGRSLPGGDSSLSYTGGLTLNHENVKEVAMGREASFASGIFNIELWTTEDRVTWTKKNNITKNMLVKPPKTFRPVIPRNHRDDFKLLFLGGRYDSLNDWGSYVYIVTGNVDEFMELRNVFSGDSSAIRNLFKEDAGTTQNTVSIRKGG